MNGVVFRSIKPEAFSKPDDPTLAGFKRPAAKVRVQELFFDDKVKTVSFTKSESKDGESDMISKDLNSGF